jgi:hypothetical protein
MPSTFTQNKGLEMPASGSYTNAWAAPVNFMIDSVDAALGGTTVINVTGISAGTYALTQPQYLNCNIEFTGTLGANVIYVLPPGVGGNWTIYNNTSGAFTLSFGISGGNNIPLIQGVRNLFNSDGTSMSYADNGLLTLAENFATAADTVVLSTAEAFATAADAVVTTNTEAFATSAASNAQTNAENFTLAQGYAPLASPALTGTPTAPTAAVGTSTTQLATTAFSAGTSSLASNGWVKYPSGLMEIWGTATLSVSGTAYSFSAISGATFPTACFQVLITPIAGGGIYPGFSVTGISTTGFTLNANNAGPYFFRALGH